MNRPGDGGHPVVPGELLAHLEQRQHQAQEQVDRLHTAIAELSDQLNQAQQLLQRLQLTHQTLLEVTEPTRVTDQQPEPTDTLPPAYQNILAILTRTDSGLRAKQLCLALKTGTEPRHVEAMRAKLKRLVGRDILTEPEPGLFTLNQSEH